MYILYSSLDHLYQVYYSAACLITKSDRYYKVIKKVGFSLPSIFSQLTDSDRSLGYGVFAYRAELIFSPIRMKYSLFSPGPNVLDEVTLGS